MCIYVCMYGCVYICVLWNNLNFRLRDNSCELNDPDQFTHPSYPEDYGPRAGYVYMDSPRENINVWF